MAYYFLNIYLLALKAVTTEHAVTLTFNDTNCLWLQK